MHRIVLALAIVVCAHLLLRGTASAVPAAPNPPPSAAIQAQQVDDNDDTRVEVQLVVLGIAAGVVFVAGTGIYLLRRKLGLVPPPPEQGTDSHH